MQKTNVLAGAMYPDSRMRQKICPFISTGPQIINCLGLSCYAGRKIIFDEGYLCVCSLLEPEFAEDRILPVTIQEKMIE